MSSTSKLTSLTATPSTPGSFYTVAASSSQPEDGTITETSSPVAQGATRAVYRDARPLPRELHAHCSIHLEEQLYQSALHNLNILVTAGGSPLLGHTLKPALVPAPSQIALLGTIMIHPAFTTRASASEAENGQSQAAAQAHQLLRSILQSVGPVKAGLRTAFEFQAVERGHRVRRGGGARGDEGGSGDEFGASVDSGDSDDGDRLKGRMANEHSVWRRGADFWGVLGWAFNCASLHAARWRFWRVWLAMMLDVLEEDWKEREQLDLHEPIPRGAARRSPEDDCDWPHLRDSLLMAYIKGRRDGRTGLRNVIRAIFANGRSADISLYPEVFDRETAAPSSNKRKRARTLDVENGQYADYLDGEDSLVSEDEGSKVKSEVPRKRRPKKQASEHAPAVQLSDAGSEQAVSLKMKLFSLLSRASHRLPDAFVPLDELYEQFCDSVRGQPIQLFARFVSCDRELLEVQYAYFLRTLVDVMMPSGIPDPDKIDRETDEQNGVSTELLEHCFLPFAANNNAIDSNAKLSLVLEQMLRLVWRRDGDHVGNSYTDGLGNAILQGITAREAKTRRKGAKMMNDDEAAARTMLEDSSRGLRIMLDVYEAEADDIDRE